MPNRRITIALTAFAVLLMSAQSNTVPAADLGLFAVPEIADAAMKNSEPSIVSQSDEATSIAAPAIVAQLGGVTRAVAYDGRAIYLGVGTRVLVLDGCDPTRALEIGRSSHLPGIVQDLVLGRDLSTDRPLLFAALGAGGIAVLDIRDPSRPEQLGSIALPGPPPDLPGEAHRLAVDGGFVWVAGSAGLYGIDVGNPSDPRLRAHVETPEGGFGGRAFDVAAADETVFVAWGPYGLRVFDASDPGSPVEVAADPSMPVAAGGIALAHDVAWLTDGGMLRAIDVSEPTAPRELSSTSIGLPTDTAIGVEISGIRAYVTFIDGTAFRGHIRALDISDPNAPRLRGTADVDTIVAAPGPTLPDGALDIAVIGPRVLAAGDTLGLVALNGSAIMRDVPPPVEPPSSTLFVEDPLLWTHTPGSSIRAAAASHSLGLVLGADTSRGMALVERPLAGARIAAWTDIPPTAREMAAYGNRAMVVNGQVHLLAIGTPSDPRHLHGVSTLTQAVAVAVDEARSVAYVANSAEGMRVITIAPDDRLTMAGTLVLTTPSETSVAAIAIDVKDDLVAVLGSSWLFLVDVSDPFSPRTLGSISTSGPATGVAIQGSTVWVSSLTAGLSSFDVSDPMFPGQIGSVPLDTGGWAIVIDQSGDVAFVAAGSGGIAAFDITDPLAPIETDRYDTPGSAYDVAIMHGEWDGPDGSIDLGDGWPLAADSEGGLVIIGDPALVTAGPEAIPPAAPDAPAYRCPERHVWLPSARTD